MEAPLSEPSCLLFSDLTNMIETYSYPWPKLDVKAGYNPAAFTSILLIGMSFAYAPSSFATDVVKDRQVCLFMHRFLFQLINLKDF